jgi:hypothetical protein
MKNTAAFAGLLAAVTLFGAAAFAAEPFLPRMQRAFDKLDADKDGKVTTAEFLPLAQRRFLRDDSNKDGLISRAEIDAALSAAMERRRDRILANMDTDKDGSISRAELDSFASALVKGADADGDGGVTLAEARSFRLAKWRKSLQTGQQSQ